MTWRSRGREANGVARIRTIKPEFWCSRQVAECSTNARLLFVGLWNFCDDHGIHPADAKQLKMEVYPADNFTDCDIVNMVTELRNVGLVAQYQCSQSRYWWHVTGWSHQKIDRPRYIYPAAKIDDGSPTVRRPFVESSTTARSLPNPTRPDTTVPDTPLNPPKGGERENGDADAISTDLYTKAFRLWYALYPRQAGKQAAARAFQRAMKRIAKELGGTKQEAFDWLCERTSHYGRTPAGAAGTFTPYPATWLNQGHYDDDPKEWERLREQPDNLKRVDDEVAAFMAKGDDE